jgi:hypothetical protein
MWMRGGGGRGRGWKRMRHSSGRPFWERCCREERLRMVEKLKDELEAELEEIKRKIERLRR